MTIAVEYGHDRNTSRELRARPPIEPRIHTERNGFGTGGERLVIRLA